MSTSPSSPGKVACSDCVPVTPERKAPAHEVFPEPRLAFVHAGRGSGEERRAVERIGDALLVHRVPGLVQRGEETVRQVVVAVAGGDAHVAAAELGHVRMRRLVLPSLREVVAERADHLFAEGLLRALRKIAGETAAVGLRTGANGGDQRHEPGAQLGKERLNGRHRHAVLGQVDERIVGMGVAGVVGGELAAQLDGLLQQRTHGGEIVGGTRPLPRMIGDRGVLAQLFDEGGGHARCALEIAARDADERGRIRIGALRFRPGLERIEEAPDLGIGLPVVAEATQQRELAAPGFRAARRHVSGLVPVQQRGGAAQVVDFLQARLERCEFGVAGHCGMLSVTIGWDQDRNPRFLGRRSMPSIREPRF